MLVISPFSTEDIVKATSGILINGDMGVTFKGICTDTRLLEPEFLFFALKGRNFDGHTFWKEAIEKGAGGLVFHRIPEDLKLEELPQELSVILVKDTIRALGDLAQFFRVRESFRVIAITGSCGKTTTKELTYTLLSNFYRVRKNEANYNNLIGVPLSLLSFTDKPEWAILEVGTSEKGEIGRLAEIVQPEISLITCIYPAHLEGLGTLEGVLEEKVSLFERTDPSGTIIYFYDQPLLRNRAQRFPQRKISYGEDLGADLRLLGINSLPEGSKVLLEYEGKHYEWQVPLSGKHNILNLLGALAIGVATGLAMETLLETLSSVSPLLVRSKIYQLGDIILVDDTYNANPGSVTAALNWLSDVDMASGEKILILGDMKELGEEAPRYHREIGELAGFVVDRAIFIGDMAEHYAEGYKSSGKSFNIYKRVEDFLEKATIPTKKALVYIKGSRSLRMERIVEKLLKGMA
ncbi:MAG: UDP-N-acetylmuramoyl-tripeptide--D-alanyl-D-alanine ligase [Caldimicrobium sp.]|nr:UDP-N-acetylmuramoyl-tripeptide--D-alanyl-D-alanine ligase [Caldimicrobium sp.]MCX7612963.1 UDP-N-acetylmuramoyl-tripeptide--D-alanyl-D-alanine ligase [Caldimicrobium sp.]MDW8183201.1 UDP-N-acetylmuramoyl-tripeptide--D-alanyl-D-alanine ligase [Caldimicrobium sp.]